MEHGNFCCSLLFQCSFSPIFFLVGCFFLCPSVRQFLGALVIWLNEIWPNHCSSPKANSSRPQTRHSDQGFGVAVKSGERTSPVPNWNTVACLVVISPVSCCAGARTQHIRTVSFMLKAHKEKATASATQQHKAKCSIFSCLQVM